MDLFQAIILGLVEGITEYIPISSTGHLILAKIWLGLEGEAINAYLIVIQSGAILAVLGLYRKRVGVMIQGVLGKHASGLKLAINLIIAFLPAAIVGFFFHDLIKDFLFHSTPVIFALAIGGVLMLFAARWQRHAFHEGDDAKSFIDIEHLTWRGALIIGILQCFALWPGTSRSMMTIVAGMAVGMKPKHAAEFSFLLGLPTLGGATVYELLKNREAISTLETVPVIMGIVVAFISAAIAIKWLVAYLSKHGLAIFGWYRIALAGVLAFGIYNDYFTLDGNKVPITSTPAGSTLIELPSTILDTVHWPTSRVAIHNSPLTSTGPTTDCQLPVNISSSPSINVQRKPWISAPDETRQNTSPPSPARFTIVGFGNNVPPSAQANNPAITKKMAVFMMSDRNPSTS